MTEIQAISGLIKDINSFISASSLRRLEELSSIGRYKLNKLVEGEEKPTLEELFSLLKALGKKDKFQDYCHTLYPEMANHISGFRSSPVEVEFTNAQYEAHLQNEENDKLMTICSFGKGCKIEELEDKFGRSCFKSLKTLIQRNIITENYSLTSEKPDGTGVGGGGF